MTPSPAPEEAMRLLPCPFCGGDASLGASPEGAFINCIECLASTNVLSPWKQTHEEAIAAWNRRAGDEREAWRPIESAPRDGTTVLLYRPLAHKTHDPHITIRRTTSYNNHCWEETIPPGANGENFTEGACYATHWQPLPSAPPRAALAGQTEGERNG